MTYIENNCTLLYGGNIKEYIYYWHKVKHIPFVKTSKVLGTLRTNTFETIPNFDCGKQQKQNTSLLINNNLGISDLFMCCKHLTKFTHQFYKIQRKQHGGQESAKCLQLGHDSCHFFKRLSLGHMLSGSGEKNHELAHNNQLLQVKLVYILPSVE